MQYQGTPIMTATNVTNMNIVLVRGTYVDGSSSSKVIPILQNAGHRSATASPFWAICAICVFYVLGDPLAKAFFSISLKLSALTSLARDR